MKTAHSFAEKSKESTLVPASIEIQHGFYGCETGCCGSDVVVLDKTGNIIGYNFEFGHDYDHRIPEAEELSKLLEVPFENKEENRKAVDSCW